MTVHSQRDTRSATEIESTAIAWLRESLEDPEITGCDNFLDVGGHSLTFTKLNAYLREHVGLSLDIQAMYEKTISEACADATVAYD